MKLMILISGFFALCCASCGWLSNDVFYEGYGHVSGRLLIGDEPARGALVFVQDEAGVWDRGKSDETGAFYIAARAGRSQKLVAMWGDASGLQRTFELPMDADKDLGDLQMMSFGQLKGQVQVQAMNPAEAELLVQGTDWSTRPNAQGDYLLNLPPGNWNVKVQAAGHLDEELKGLKVREGEQHLLDPIELQANQDYVCAESRPMVDKYFQMGTGALDILFVIDNSRSMVGEQISMAQAMAGMVTQLQKGEVDYRLAVVTTGVESEACPPCPPDNPNYYSCINETGETGRFQNQIGHNEGTVDEPQFTFEVDDSCKVMGMDNLSCFYDELTSSGIGLLGVNGCGYERGLSALRKALSPPLVDTWNAGFLRQHARLALVVVSDEDDCGEPGETHDNLPGVAGWACYYAAKGVAPDGSTIDPEGLPFELSPTEEYAQFFRSLKDSPAQVSFSALIGVQDPKNPGATTIEYEGTELGSVVRTACTNTECVEACAPDDQVCPKYCAAFPGTRYISLAQELGGTVESICQSDFHASLSNMVGNNTGYRYSFALRNTPLDSELIAVRVSDQLNPDWTYDQLRNEIVFAPGLAPEQFETIEIEYTAACP